MEPSIFEFQDYRRYLQAFLWSLPRQGHGFKTRMAELMECDTAYVQRVFCGKAQLSLDQAESLQGVLWHNTDEALYFLLLVQLVRAKTPALRERVEAEMARLQRHRESRI